MTNKENLELSIKALEVYPIGKQIIKDMLAKLSAIEVENNNHITSLIDKMIEKESPYWRLGIAKIAVLRELKQKILGVEKWISIN